MEPDISLPYSQEAAACPNPEPGWIHFDIIRHVRPGLLSGLPWGLPIKTVHVFLFTPIRAMSIP